LGAIHEAGDGIEALQVLGDQWIDIVFTDLNMPRMDGVELIGKMAEDRCLQSTPIVVITSDRNDLRLAELKERGVLARLNKPFRPEALRDVMGEVLAAAEKGDRHGS
jgi:two-component system chemotaxis response regulator CheY